MRLHAIGDVALILPAAASLRAMMPGTRIDLVTSPAAAGLADAAELFHGIFTCVTAGSRTARLLRALRLGGTLRRRRYDLVIDLQRNWMTRIMRRIASPPSWGEFDRFSLRPAWIRITDTITRSGLDFPKRPPSVCIPPARAQQARALLAAHGHREGRMLVIINPGGLWPTRNWPERNYVELCIRWREAMPVTFLILGTERVRRVASAIHGAVGPDVIDLSHSTTLREAFEVLSLADVMVTEDSGLMHMAWAAGVPIVALFGSSRHQWSAPYGERSVTLDSSDLPCCACMEPACRFGDVHCLTRYSPELILAEALNLLKSTPTLEHH
ncbi:MAG: glycosyltransferase family 9 protein [Bacteroidota bacterium]